VNRLRELQLGFSRHVFGGGDSSFGAQIRANGICGEQRLRVYHNNAFGGFTKALRARYPVICALVGDGFFRYAAAQYIAQQPSTSGDLHDFGETFPEFLENFEPAAKLEYLGDVARLELAYDEALCAADHAPLDLSALAGVPPERYDELQFILHPASRLLASDFPILRIWQINQPDYQGEQTVDWTAGGEYLLVIRRGFDMEIQPLAAGDYALLQAFASRQHFATACEQALFAQSDYDVTAGFRSHILHGAIVDFRL